MIFFKMNKFFYKPEEIDQPKLILNTWDHFKIFKMKKIKKFKKSYKKKRI